MHRMKPRKISPADRAELSRLGIHGVDAVGIHRTIAKLSMFSPKAIYEVERLVGSVPPRQSWLWFRPATNRDVEIDPIHAPVLMFNRNGYVREAALKGVNQLPDTPFFLAALVWRLNDWVEPVRRAAEGCAKLWSRWGSPPAIMLDALARPECVHGLMVQFARTAEISAAALRGAMRFGLLDNHLLWMWLDVRSYSESGRM
jgi:hypothetical protein